MRRREPRDIARDLRRHMRPPDGEMVEKGDEAIGN
jgi:hypothetical protein